MIYALNLAQDGRILSATYDKYAPASQPRMDHLPEGNLYEYRYVNGEFIHDPLPAPEPSAPQPTQEERIAELEGQVSSVCSKLLTYEIAYTTGVNEV